jgi:hypothetical protein
MREQFTDYSTNDTPSKQIFKAINLELLGSEIQKLLIEKLVDFKINIGGFKKGVPRQIKMLEEDLK